MSPGQVAAIRNKIISSVLQQASRELHLAPEKLIVRDVLPHEDLDMYLVTTTDATVEMWAFTSTNTTSGWLSVTGSKTMADQRYVALFGVRDLANFCGSSANVTISATDIPNLGGYAQSVSAIKINVGGADKVIWDASGIRSAGTNLTMISPTAIVIPPGVSYQIYHYQCGLLSAGAAQAPLSGAIAKLQLVGITVEPRGKLISP
jgi:hypothetical protein